MGKKVVIVLLALLIIIGLGIGVKRFLKKEEKINNFVVASPVQWRDIQLFGYENSVNGFCTDLLNTVSSLAGFKSSVIKGDYSTFSSMLDEGSVDAVMTALPPNTYNERYYEFSESFFTAGIIIVVAQHSPFHTIRDLQGAEIAFDQSETGQITIGMQTSWLLRPYATSVKALEDVIQGRIDGFLTSSLNANRLQKSFYRSKVRMVYPPLSVQNIRLAVKRGKNHEFIERFNEGLKQCIERGSYQRLLDYWGIDSFIQFSTEQTSEDSHD